MYQVVWILIMEDLINQVAQIRVILSIIVEIDLQNTQLPKVMYCKFGRSIQSIRNSHEYFVSQMNYYRNCMTYF